jgi:hypothetical protein
MYRKQEEKKSEPLQIGITLSWEIMKFAVNLCVSTEGTYITILQNSGVGQSLTDIITLPTTYKTYNYLFFISGWSSRAWTLDKFRKFSKLVNEVVF